MDVGIIVLVLVGALFTIALYCMLVTGIFNRDEGTENNDDDYARYENAWLRIDIWILVFSILLFSAGVGVGTTIAANYYEKAAPETEATVESTTAPTIDILPTEPSVPETTEAYTVETTEPTEVTVPETKPESTETTPPETRPEPTSAPVTDEPDTDHGFTDLEMLACVIYQEAGGNGSCDNCRRYVADIVLNRVEHDGFPDNIYEVLTQKGQYGRLYWTGIKWAERAKYTTEKEAVARAYRIAAEVLNGQHSKLYGEGYIWQAGFKQGTDGFWCCGHWYGR